MAYYHHIDKYYAVAHGRQIGIYRTWTECIQATTGVKYKKYRGFTSLQEAAQFITDYRANTWHEQVSPQELVDAYHDRYFSVEAARDRIVQKQVRCLERAHKYSRSSKR